MAADPAEDPFKDVTERQPDIAAALFQLPLKDRRIGVRTGDQGRDAVGFSELTPRHEDDEEQKEASHLVSCGRPLGAKQQNGPQEHQERRDGVRAQPRDDLQHCTERFAERPGVRHEHTHKKHRSKGEHGNSRYVLHQGIVFGFLTRLRHTDTPPRAP